MIPQLMCLLWGVSGALVGRSILQHLYHFILSNQVWTRWRRQVLMCHILLAHIDLMTRSHSSIKGGNKSPSSDQKERRSRRLLRIYKSTYLPTLHLGGTPPRTVYLLRVLYIPVCRDNAYYRVETKGKPGEEIQQMKRVNELRSPGDLIVFPQTLAKKK